MTNKGRKATTGRKPARGRRDVPVAAPARPWGIIAGTIAVVLFAGAVIGYGAYRVRDSASRSPAGQAAAAADIEGVVTKDYPGRDHQDGPVAYDQSPPFGGAHDPAWADCTGTVYPKAIRAENAVHSLEHGAAWVTYRPDLPADQVAGLRRLVEGREYRMMSPSAGLADAVSLQTWGHQLKVASASDPRVTQFLDRLTQNSETTPEYGASCANPQFKSDPRPPTPVPGG